MYICINVFEIFISTYVYIDRFVHSATWLHIYSRTHIFPHIYTCMRTYTKNHTHMYSYLFIQIYVYTCYTNVHVHTRGYINIGGRITRTRTHMTHVCTHHAYTLNTCVSPSTTHCNTLQYTATHCNTLQHSIHTLILRASRTQHTSTLNIRVCVSPSPYPITTHHPPPLPPLEYLLRDCDLTW